MSIQRVPGLEVEGTLRVTLGPTFREPEYRRPGVVPESAAYRYGVTRSSPEKVWISAPEVRFAGTVTVRGPAQRPDWQIGLLQSITAATWAGHYANGEYASYRLNTDYGPVKDTLDDQSAVFFRDPCRLTALAPGVQEAKVDQADAPSVTFLTRFSGDPLRPDIPERSAGQLVRTEGEYRFRTFLAAVNRAARTIITLARCDWTATFDGGYDADPNVWTPTVAGVVRLQVSDEGATYEDISRSTPLPFSLHMDTPLAATEIRTPGSWVTCHGCLPSSDRGYAPSGRWWEA
jgi:hypothetical protein